MPKLDILEKVHEIADHSGSKADSAGFPLEHFQQGITEFRTLVDYFDRKVGDTTNYLAVKNRHFARLHGMVMVNLIECLERFFKEVAAVCIDQVAGLVGDDRFTDFKALAPGALRAHFEAGSFGLALSESLRVCSKRVLIGVT